MNLIKLIVERKILIGLTAVLVLIAGGYAVLKLDKELFPPIDLDAAYVEIQAGEMSAIEVERNITNVIENSILSVDGIEGVTSTSAVGRSSLQVMLEEGRGDELYQEVQAAVSAAVPDISGIENVETGQYGTNQSYEFYMDISDGNMREITDFAKNILKPRLEELPEVREVSLVGTEESEITITFNRKELQERGWHVSDIIALIQGMNSEATLGELSSETDSPSLRWNSQLVSVDDLERLKIPGQDGFVELQDIADVSLQPLQSSSNVYKNGTKDFVFVQVGRTSDVTQIDMAEAIRNELQAIREEGLVDGFTLNEMVAQADYVQDSIDGVSNNIVIGAAIAVAILLLFLHNLRATFIIALSIPTSILLTFATMWLFDYSINILTLIGLGLGIGMMVDASIVILESIYRKKQQGLAGMEAVVAGTKEVATAVIASMMTTIVVFLPIGLIAGEMGRFVMILSAVVVITLLSSVIVSFTLIPALAQHFLKLGKRHSPAKEGKLLQGYAGLISWIVRKKRHSLAIMALFFLMFAGSLFLVQKIPMSIMPDMYNRYNELAVEMETGISAAEKDALFAEINDSLMSIQDVESNYVMDNGDMAYLIINMTKDDDITREQQDINEEIMRSLRELSEDHPLTNAYSMMGDGGGGYPVQIHVKGDSFDQLQAMADELAEDLQAIDGIVGVTNSIERSAIEEVVELKEQAMEDAGVSPLEMQQRLKEAFLDMPIGELTVDNENVPVFVKWDDPVEKKQELLDLTVPTFTGEKKLSDLININSVDIPNEIKHTDGERYISISADIEEKDLGTINREVQQLLNSYDAPSGYSLSLSGDLEQQQELMNEMLLVLGIAIFLVYLVMAVQFNHLIHPVIVMSVIPMTIVGAILGLFLTQMELSLMSAMGIVMLIGIVLNNAILLIDRTNKLRKEGLSVQDALIEAGKNRIRPIFMTTLTTSGGMLPLAIASGTSGNYQAPMATVIISGLLFATFITLLLIPAVYRIFSSIGNGLRFSSKRSNGQPIEVDNAQAEEAS
nr:efflux RND transporter permease subunit [Evansella caseinilytica]